MFRSAIEKAGLTFVVDCKPLAAPVYVDREMWERVSATRDHRRVARRFSHHHRQTQTRGKTDRSGKRARGRGGRYSPGGTCEEDRDHRLD